MLLKINIIIIFSFGDCGVCKEVDICRNGRQWGKIGEYGFLARRECFFKIYFGGWGQPFFQLYNLFSGIFPIIAQNYIDKSCQHIQSRCSKQYSDTHEIIIQLLKNQNIVSKILTQSNEQTRLNILEIAVGRSKKVDEFIDPIQRIDVICNKSDNNIQNKDDDKFEVDLLLPFSNQKEKEQFICNFKSRDKKKMEKWTNSQYQSIKFANPKNRAELQCGGYNSHKNKKHMDSSSQIAQQYSHIHESQVKQIAPNANEQADKKASIVNLKDISLVIQNKLKEAVKQIMVENKNKKNSRSSQHQHIGPTRQSQVSQESAHGIKSKRKNSQSNDVQQEITTLFGEKPRNFRNQGHGNRPHRGKLRSQNIQNSHNSSQLHREKRSDVSDHSNKKQPYEHQNNNGHLTGTFNNRRDGHNKSQDNNNLQTQLNNDDEQNSEAGEEEKSYSRGKNNGTLSQRSKQRKDSDLQKSKQKSINKPKDSQSSSTSIRQRYTQFMKQSHRQFSKIYQNIQKDIKRNDRQLRKQRKNHPILVLQQNLIDVHGQSQEDRVFKEEIIKEYQKHIVAQNKCLSSQDLVRYFKYLLEHANTLYIKHLRKTK